MRTALVIALLLVAFPAYGKSLYCVLWPRAEACRPAQVVVPPAPVFVPEPTTPVIVERPVPKAVTPQRRIKSTWVKPKRKPIRVRDEPGLPAGMCSILIAAGRVGKTMDDVLAAAKARGRKMNARQRSEALRCLNS